MKLDRSTDATVVPPPPPVSPLSSHHKMRKTVSSGAFHVPSPLQREESSSSSYSTSSASSASSSVVPSCNSNKGKNDELSLSQHTETSSASLWESAYMMSSSADDTECSMSTNSFSTGSLSVSNHQQRSRRNLTANVSNHNRRKNNKKSSKPCKTVQFVMAMEDDEEVFCEYQEIPSRWEYKTEPQEGTRPEPNDVWYNPWELYDIQSNAWEKLETDRVAQAVTALDHNLHLYLVATSSALQQVHDVSNPNRIVNPQKKKAWHYARKALHQTLMQCSGLRGFEGRISTTIDDLAVQHTQRILAAQQRQQDKIAQWQSRQGAKSAHPVGVDTNRRSALLQQRIRRNEKELRCLSLETSRITAHYARTLAHADTKIAVQAIF